jgi:uncharacterized protein (DUF433 family)
MNALLGRISIESARLVRQAGIHGTRIWVSRLPDLLVSGGAQERILKRYPQLAREDILRRHGLGAQMSRGRCVDLPDPSAA